MAGSRKSRLADVAERVRAFIQSHSLEGSRVAVALSGGIDSVVLLELMRLLGAEFGFELRAVHVHHGLSPNADAWARFCRRICAERGVPITVRRVTVGTTRGQGLEAAARKARYAVFSRLRCDALLLAHHRDDQAETVLFNLLRGAGLRGASGMPAAYRREGRLVLRPLLDTSRGEIAAYARAAALAWIEDESNANDAITRNFLRHCVGPLLAQRFPAWQRNLARAAKLFGGAQADERALLREFLRERGLRAPSEARLAEMLRQLTKARPDASVAIEHDGAVLRRYRGTVSVAASRTPARFDAGLPWNGERRLRIDQLAGELRFVRGQEGIALSRLAGRPLSIQPRRGGERLRLGERRPRRSLKNLFQEAGVATWDREALPLLFCGEDLVWVPMLGIDVAYRAAPGEVSVLPHWVPD